MNNKKITIIGDGGWGTTLAVLLSRKGYSISLWGAFPEYCSYVNKHRVNTKFLPGIKIPGNILITGNLKKVLASGELIVFAVPSQHMREVLKKIRKAGYPKDAVYLSVTKGIEIGSLKRMSEVIREELGKIKLGVMSGPTIAHEVAKGAPATAVVSSQNPKISKYLQDIFITERFRIYTNPDVIGVELGGSIKNVIAIACGISDGMGFGTNSKAAILSRGLAEISRLGKAMGARNSTFSGISGLGDLVTTCISSYSRNRFVGEQLGKGKTLKQIESKMQMVAEGVPTAKSAYALAKKYKVEMPITAEIYRVLYESKSPLKAVKDLMTRKKKGE